jgi:hypothetical protein
MFTPWGEQDADRKRRIARLLAQDAEDAPPTAQEMEDFHASVQKFEK